MEFRRVLFRSKLEEERFGSTLTVGLQKLDALFSVAHDGALPDYKELARLYDTFGTPRDLIRVSMEERGFPIDEETFNAAFDAALKGIQGAGEREQTSAGTKVKPVYAVVAERAGRSEFKGYEETRTDDARVVALING